MLTRVAAKTMNSLLLTTTLAAFAVAQSVPAPNAASQATTPPHPEIKKTDRRAEISRQTEEFSAPNANANTEPVARQNFIDDYIFGKMERDGVPHAPLADDATFFRRVHLDLSGRIPDAQQAQDFVASDDPRKRDKLIDELVGSVEWRERWTYRFLDLWRASQNRVGWPGRNLFHSYVYDALQYKQPFDEFVREMITASARSNWYVGPASYLGAAKRPDGSSVLDETLVIAMGEFGRTPGELTNIAGRDHYQYAFTGCFAGGGVKPGQIIGKTDEQGAKIVDPGWSQKRSVYMEDLATTIYSAMGIDWTKKIEETPSGRAFYYIEIFSPTQLLANREVSELFG